jgi:F-type H+-transporting ATPase subunit a
MFNFITILLLNIFGMFVFTFTVTSHLSLTFFIALSYFIGSNIVGVFYQFQLFFNLFLPKSLPVLLTPLLFFLEVVSYLSRVFSLAIRLFANMLSGHALMKILGGIA